MISTTLGRIRAAEPCADGWRRLLAALGEGGDPNLARAVTLENVLEHNGVADAVWAARHACDLTTADERALRLFASDCAEHALRTEREAGREPGARSWAAVEAARAYARGEIGVGKLCAAYAAACAAGWVAVDAACAVARAAAAAAAWAAHADARASASAAAAAAYAAARVAARAARADARAAADAAASAERAWQAERLLAYLRGEVS